jgi:hypothetical protein
VERRIGQLRASEPHRLAEDRLADGRAPIGGDALPRGVDPGAARQPPRSRRSRPVREARLRPAAHRLPAVALRGAPARGQRADPLDAVPEADRGRTRRAEARRAVRAVRPSRAADRNGRAGRALPHPGAVADRDRERGRRPLAQPGARDVLPLVRLVPADRRGRRPPLGGRLVRANRARAPGAVRVELRPVLGHRAHRHARDRSRLVARRGA